MRSWKGSALRESESGGAPGEGGADEPTPEQLVEAMRELRVRDLLVTFFTSTAQLGYAKLDPGMRDLADARLAIDTLRALVPVVEGAVPDETLRDFRQVVSNLQLAYAGAAASPEEEHGAESGGSTA